MALDLDHAHRTIVSRASVFPRSVWTALGVGVAFGMGVVVGGGLGTAHGQASVPSQLDVLAAAEARANELEAKRDKVKLSFAAELARPDAPPAVRPEEKLSKVSRVSTSTAAAAGEHDAAPLDAPRVESDADVAPPADKASSGKPPGAAGAGPATAAAPVVASHDPRPREAGAPADAPAGAPAGAPADAAEGDDDVPTPTPEKADPARLQQALAKVLGNAPAVVESRSTTGFALQVASSPTRAAAEAVVQKLLAEGHKNAKVVEGDVGGKAVFRVRVGGFSARASADAYKTRLSTPSFIVAE